MKNYITFINESIDNELLLFLDNIMISDNGRPQLKKIGHVYLELMRDHYDFEEVLYISDIQSHKSGEGQHVLSMICEWADKNSITLTLAAVPGGHGFHNKIKTSSERLVNWYKRNGFEVDDEESKRVGEPFMFRSPDKGLNEALYKRKDRIKTDLEKVDVVYHWLTEGKLFESCYKTENSDQDKSFLLDIGPIPTLPSPTYSLSNICLTVDYSYFDPAFNEEGSCLVLDFKKLYEDFEIEDLTDNGEAEIRINQAIPDWTKYLIKIQTPSDVYNDGTEWEDFEFRAIKEWLPIELKAKVETFDDLDDLLKKRQKEDL